MKKHRQRKLKDRPKDIININLHIEGSAELWTIVSIKRNLAKNAVTYRGRIAGIDTRTTKGFNATLEILILEALDRGVEEYAENGNT